MQHVAKDMTKLKEKAAEETIKAKMDDCVKQMEKERDWFRTEAVNLKKQCNEHSKTL